MGEAKGGKTRQPDARTVAVKLGQHERGLLAEIVYKRIQAGASYDETTQAGVVKDAIRHLAELELGKKTVEVESPGVQVEQVAPSAPFVGPQAAEEVQGPSLEQLQAEYSTFTTAEGVGSLPWDQFLTIRKLRIQKGAWKYGPNQL